MWLVLWEPRRLLVGVMCICGGAVLGDDDVVGPPSSLEEGGGEIGILLTTSVVDIYCDCVLKN